MTISVIDYKKSRSPRVVNVKSPIGQKPSIANLSTGNIINPHFDVSVNVSKAEVCESLDSVSVTSISTKSTFLVNENTTKRLKVPKLNLKALPDLTVSATSKAISPRHELSMSPKGSPKRTQRSAKTPFEDELKEDGFLDPKPVLLALFIGDKGDYEWQCLEKYSKDDLLEVILSNNLFIATNLFCYLFIAFSYI